MTGAFFAEESIATPQWRIAPPKIKNAPPLNRSCTPLTGFYQNYGSLPEITPVVGFSGCWLFFFSSVQSPSH